MSDDPDSRTFVVGDVHGCEVALGVLLDQLALTRKDRLVMLGDLVDRGPDSKRVVETLLDARQSCRFDLVMGNHEEMLLAAVHDRSLARFWLECGGDAALASYGGQVADIPDEHLEFLTSAVPYVETESHILIHASLEPDVPLEEQTAAWLRWEKLTGWERPHPSGKRVVCGHTEIPGGVPRMANGWLMLDTACYRGSYLTAVELKSGEIFQASQSSNFRGGVHLHEL